VDELYFGVARQAVHARRALDEANRGVQAGGSKEKKTEKPVGLQKKTTKGTPCC